MWSSENLSLKFMKICVHRYFYQDKRRNFCSHIDSLSSILTKALVSLFRWWPCCSRGGKSAAMCNLEGALEPVSTLLSESKEGRQETTRDADTAADECDINSSCPADLAGGHQSSTDPNI